MCLGSLPQAVRNLNYVRFWSYASYNRIWCLKEFEVCGVPCWNRFCLAIKSNKRSTPHMTNNTVIDLGTPEGIDPLTE